MKYAVWVCTLKFGWWVILIAETKWSVDNFLLEMAKTYPLYDVVELSR
jgi:hypothetical protein